MTDGVFCDSPRYESEDLRHAVDGAAWHEPNRGDVASTVMPRRSYRRVAPSLPTSTSNASRGGASGVLGVLDEERPDPCPTRGLIDSHSLEIPVSPRKSVHEVEESPGEQPRSYEPDGPNPCCSKQRPILRSLMVRRGVPAHHADDDALGLRNHTCS